MLSGTIVADWYIPEGHQFTVCLDKDGSHYYTTGACLYRRRLAHEPGETSLKDYKKALKKKNRSIKQHRRKTTGRKRAKRARKARKDRSY